MNKTITTIGIMILALTAVFALVVCNMTKDTIKIDKDIIVTDVLKIERDENNKTDQRLKKLDEAETGVFIEMD